MQEWKNRIVRGASQFLGRRPVESVTSQSPQRDLTSLRNFYTVWRGIADTDRNTRAGISDTVGTALERSLSQLLAAVPDETQRGVLRVLHNHDFNLDEVFQAQEAGDWTQPFKDQARIFLELLGGKAHEKEVGEPFPHRIPYPPEDMLMWILHLTKYDPTRPARESLSAGLAQSMRDRIICGRPQEEWGLHDSDVRTLYSTTVLLMLMGRKYAPSFSVFTDIAVTVPTGEEWLKRIIAQS